MPKPFNHCCGCNTGVSSAKAGTWSSACDVLEKARIPAFAHGRQLNGSGNGSTVGWCCYAANLASHWGSRTFPQADGYALSRE